ncbi:MAG: sigma-70 family RNA polymerase sigma factor [Oscillospiraceae bacterium]|nr:sigma-70 family RNA polymerase sigma factor [Oscillospiraceae bacterium]
MIDREQHPQPLTDQERKLAEKYHPLVGKFLSHARLDSDKYYDIVVFGLLKFVQQISAGKLQEKPGIQKAAYLYMRWELARNRRYLNQKKRNGCKLVHMEDEVYTHDHYLLTRGEITADPHQNTVLHAERRDLICRALAEATTNQMAVIELKYQGLSGKEIAKYLGISETAVKSRIFKFQRKAKELLKEEPPASAGNTVSGK